MYSCRLDAVAGKLVVWIYCKTPHKATYLNLGYTYYAVSTRADVRWQLIFLQALKLTRTVKEV